MSQIDQPTDAASLARPSRRATVLRGVASRVPDEVGVLIALVLIVLVVGIPHSNFVKPFNLLQIIGSSSFYGMIALGVVFLLANAGVFRFIDFRYVWPIAIIALGAFIILQRTRA
jgi:ribose transport system permease protein